ncbi:MULTISPECIES: hypothetical protein [Martelella]|uniref:hypothetical protein n=1 Tax=Martelella TaxID=293088 RepID=UPI0012BA8363|nr:hypothetical protein [Martelella mediterranea]QRX65090.1 hypothetical protein JS578_13595 [Dysgonomonadaceae bacterium zrk40]
MNERRKIEPVGLLRAMILCALFAFGLTPQGAEAHSSAPAATSSTHAVVDDDHGEDHTVIQEAFGHCHPGIDCALAAITVDSERAHPVRRAATTKVRPPHVIGPVSKSGFEGQ